MNTKSLEYLFEVLPLNAYIEVHSNSKNPAIRPENRVSKRACRFGLLNPSKVLLCYTRQNTYNNTYTFEMYR
jgi:hypothetical protein